MYRSWDMSKTKIQMWGFFINTLYDGLIYITKSSVLSLVDMLSYIFNNTPCGLENLGNLYFWSIKLHFLCRGNLIYSSDKGSLHMKTLEKFWCFAKTGGEPKFFHFCGVKQHQHVGFWMCMSRKISDFTWRCAA